MHASPEIVLKFSFASFNNERTRYFQFPLEFEIHFHLRKFKFFIVACALDRNKIRVRIGQLGSQYEQFKSYRLIGHTGRTSSVVINKMASRWLDRKTKLNIALKVINVFLVLLTISST